MNVRTRTSLIAAALVAGIAAGPVAPALAHSPGHAPSHSSVSAHHPVPASDAKALRAAISDLDADGATAALVRVGGKDGIWRGSAGVHDRISQRPANPDARFRAGSVTKVFTAAVVLQLAAEKKLDLDRPARAYLPELIPADYRDVTVRQLLNHTHGMPSPDFRGNDLEGWYANRFHVYTPQALVRSALAKKPEFTPGEQQHYTNIGYLVAGLLIEKVTHDSYEHQVTRRIIKPLHLRGTYLPGTDPRIRGPHNIGYQVFPTADGTELRDASVWSTTDTWSAGALISTTADLERFVGALFNGRIVRGPLLKEMFTLPTLKKGTAMYSVGLTQWKMGGRQVWGKSGGRWGYNAGFAAPQDLSRTLVYSINSIDAKAEQRNRLIPKIAVAAFGPIELDKAAG
ncbi:serine hydrolase domain-containing protein [Streptomyces sp. NPDC003077]|uniref:serine hydrolase domain-containing protein n=1 Tax=Streptomyces sp. NPDC003077 TaxID=3154443 RepID=UPI0033BA21A6